MEYYFKSNSIKNILKCPKANLATHCLAELFPIRTIIPLSRLPTVLYWRLLDFTSLSSNMTWLKVPKVDQWPTLMLLLSVQDENQEAIGFRMDKGEMENGKIMDFRKWRLETIHQPEGNRKEGQIFSS